MSNAEQARAVAFDRWWKLSLHNGTLPTHHESLAREAYYAAWGGGSALMGVERTQDAGKIATALGLLASCVKSGDDWSEHCEKAKNEAFDALARLAPVADQREVK